MLLFAAVYYKFVFYQNLKKNNSNVRVPRYNKESLIHAKESGERIETIFLS